MLKSFIICTSYLTMLVVLCGRDEVSMMGRGGRGKHKSSGGKEKKTGHL
jgi:hypothetical protein